MRYILKDKVPIRCDDYEEWSNFLMTNRIVRQDQLAGPILISTIFLGLDHNFSGEGDPILFETMMFGAPKLEGYQMRYKTWDEAELGHDIALQFVKKVFEEKEDG